MRGVVGSDRFLECLKCATGCENSPPGVMGLLGVNGLDGHIVVEHGDGCSWIGEGAITFRRKKFATGDSGDIGDLGD